MGKPKLIHVQLGFTHLSDADLLSRLTSVHDSMAGNAAFPNPPVDPGVFKSALDAFSAAIAEALDGSKKAIAERHNCRQVALEMVVLLGHHVQAMSKNDLATLLSSGFEAKSTTRTAPQPLSQPVISKVDQGNSSGQLLVSIKPVPKARNYELRFAAQAAAGAPVQWTTITVATAKASVQIGGLTPGTTYMFQVRAFGHLGFTDFSDSVSRMVI